MTALSARCMVPAASATLPLLLPPLARPSLCALIWTLRLPVTWSTGWAEKERRMGSAGGAAGWLPAASAGICTPAGAAPAAVSASAPAPAPAAAAALLPAWEAGLQLGASWAVEGAVTASAAAGDEDVWLSSDHVALLLERRLASGSACFAEPACSTACFAGACCSGACACEPLLSCSTAMVRPCSSSQGVGGGWGAAGAAGRGGRPAAARGEGLRRPSWAPAKLPGSLQAMVPACTAPATAAPTHRNHERRGAARQGGRIDRQHSCDVVGPGLACGLHQRPRQRR